MQEIEKETPIGIESKGVRDQTISSDSEDEAVDKDKTETSSEGELAQSAKVLERIFEDTNMEINELRFDTERWEEIVCGGSAAI